MALGQLKTVAKPELIQQVAALKTGASTENLRKIITRLVDDAERQVGAMTPKTDTTAIVNQMRTLSILLDLYFSLH